VKLYYHFASRGQRKTRRADPAFRARNPGKVAGLRDGFVRADIASS